MAVGREDAIIATKIFLDGLCLGGGFDDDKFHGSRVILSHTRARRLEDCDRTSSGQAHPAARMALQPPAQLKLQPYGVDDRGRKLRQADDLIHRHRGGRSEEHTSELQSLMRISYAVFCLKKKT